MKLPGPIRLAVTAAAALVAALAAAAAVAILAAPRTCFNSRSRIVVVDLEAASGGAAQLFWSDDMAFTEEQSVHAPLQPGTPQRLRFLIPGTGVRWIRLDPSDGAGEIVIRGIQVVDQRGPVLDVPPMSLRPVNQVASMTSDGGAARIETTPGANDPFLYAPVGCLDPPSMAVVTTRALMLVTGIVAALLAAAVVAIATNGRRRAAGRHHGR